MTSEEKLLTFKIDKGIYGSLGYFYGFDFASKEMIQQLENVLNEKNQKEFFIEGSKEKFTTETIKSFFNETEKEWQEFYTKELKRQKDSIEEKQDLLKRIAYLLPSVKVFVSKEHLGDLAAFYNTGTGEFIRMWLLEKGYNASSIEEVDSNPSNTFLLLDNGKEFKIVSEAKIASDGVFSHSYLEFGLEEKLK